MNRREFLMMTAAVGTTVGLVPRAYAEPDKIVKPSAKPRNRRPYTGIDWATAHQINTTSHGHCCSESMLKEYIRHRFGLITMSNYYPSAPYYPAAEMTVNYYRCHHDFPVMVDGVRTPGPFDWNEILKSWIDKIDPKFAKQFPFKEGGKIFPNFPKDLLEAPNAEHHNFLLKNGRRAGSLHMCAPGSLFKSGTFDAHNDFGSAWKYGKYDFGSGEFWGTAIDRMIAAMEYPDGGGVTINHPTWSKLDRLLMLDILDWDPRVLGIEVLEAGVNSENYWDWALSTGRQCYGLFVPDWSIRGEVFGVNVLVTPERTAHACMKAYRDGNFYGATHGFGELKFTKIVFDGKTVFASTDKPARFEVITSKGVVKKSEGTSIIWEVTPNGDSKGPRVDVFARVKAYAADGCGETLYSQPFMLF